MPLAKLQFRPGINKETTSYGNEGGWTSCDKVRFRSGYPAKIGGWVNQSPTYTFKGVARTLINWVSFIGENLLGVGTSQKYYVEKGGQYKDITPVVSTASLTDPFATTSGSRNVTVTDTAHGQEVGNFVVFSGATTVGGITAAALNDLEGYEIVAVPTANTYVIVVPTAASSTTTGGGSVTATYLLPPGPAVSFAIGDGWGASPWGDLGWGDPANLVATEFTSVRLWSHDTYNENLVINPQGGAIYYWEKDTTNYDRAVLLSEYAGTQVKQSGVNLTAAFIAGANTMDVETTFRIAVGAVITGTGLDPGTKVTAINGGTITFTPVASGGSGGTYSFSYSVDAVPVRTNYVLVSDTNNFVMALGANPYDPVDPDGTDFNPMLVRWSDQDYPEDWVPEITNQSGEILLSRGSYLVCARDTRQEILVWSDAALYSMQYLGPPYVWSQNMIADQISIASPNSPVTVNGVTYWMGVDKFYTYSGRVEPLPCTLRQFVFDNINRSQLSQIVAGVNEGYNEVWWFYPSTNSLINDSYIIYNYSENVWYYGAMTRTAWLDSPLRQYPMAAFSVHQSYLAAPLTAGATEIQLLNGRTYPHSGTVRVGDEEIIYTSITGDTLVIDFGLDGQRGANGTTPASHAIYTPVTPVIPNQVVFHEYNNDDGLLPELQPVEAFIESADFDIGDGHQFAFVWRILPDVTFTGSDGTLGAPQVLMTLRARQNAGANYYGDTPPSTVRSATVPVEQFTGTVPIRIRGRQMALRVESDRLGTAWQLGTPRIDTRPDGRR
jgi:hypothetical protein